MGTITMTTIQEYEQRAAKWALQGSTILGIAGVVTAAIGTGVDTVTGLPWAAAAVGVAAGGLAAILLPQKDPAPIIQGAETLTEALTSHKAAMEKVNESTVAVATALAAAAPATASLAATAVGIAEKVAPVAAAVAAGSGQPGTGKAIADVDQVLTSAAAALEHRPAG